MALRLFFLLAAILLLSSGVKSDDKEDALLAGINRYRTSLNLSVLVENDNAKCLADQIAEQFEDKDCTNTTGAFTVPGTEPQLPNYPQLLAHCDLNISNTRDGVILPACVPGLNVDLVLSNFTMGQYAKYLKDSRYVGAGIASEDDWSVVVLSTNTPSGDFEKSTTSGSVFLEEGLLLMALTVITLMLMFLRN